MIEVLKHTPQPDKKLLVYDPSFDERDYRDFGSLSLLEQQHLKAYTKRQFEKYLGERVSVIQSLTRYDIVDGKMVSQDLNEPMEDIIQKGIYWRKQHGNPIDFEREEAELIGFRKSQARLTDPNTPVGAMNLSVSLPGDEGSDYANRFFDVSIVKEDGSGRYIEMRRYLSALEVEDFQEKLRPFKTFYKTPQAADFLKDPIVMDIFDDPGDIQTYLSGGVEALEAEKFEKIKQIVAPFIASYINSLINDPYNFWLHRLKYNAVLNQTDIALAAVKTNYGGHIGELYFSSQDLLEKQIQFLGMQPVRETRGPCPGKSGGFNLSGSTNEPYSVAEFGLKDEYGDRSFKCPECGLINIRPENQLIKNCQHCGSGKVAC